MEEEIWKVVPGYERYEASNIGRIRGLFNGDLIIKRQHKSRFGYMFITHTIGRRANTNKKKRKNYLVHRLIALAFIPNTDNKPYVNHKDLNKENNHVHNLEWVTPYENVYHAISNGLNQIGENNARAKLTEQDIVEIRRINKENGVKYDEIAKMYKITKSNACHILSRFSWKHI